MEDKTLRFARRAFTLKPMNQANTILLDLPAALEYLNVLEACISAMLIRDDNLSEREARIFEVKLAAHETCTNIIEHAYGGMPGRISVELSIQDGPRRFIIDIHDTGRSFSLPEIQQPNLNEPQTSGYGLFLIHQLMDEVTYEPGSGNNRWKLVKYL